MIERDERDEMTTRERERERDSVRDDEREREAPNPLSYYYIL